MNTDYLMMLSRILSGSGGVLDLIGERYTFTAAEKLGYSEDSHYEIG